jgi:transmembrane sensor
MDAEMLAAEIFTRRRFGAWSDADESTLKKRLEADPTYADAFRRVERSWSAVGQHASSAELLALREGAIARARRASARRWTGKDNRSRSFRIAAAMAGIGIALAAAYQFAPFGFKPGEYRTSIGEQHSFALEDRSHIALDAATRVRVKYSDNARIVQLIEGQVQLSVAKDPRRPFEVEAGGHTIVAVGTVFNVEYVNKEIHVAMLEGEVAVLPSPARAPGEGPSENSSLPLIAGEELRVRRDGRTAVTRTADLRAASAWREGKVIFNAEPLGEAIQRLNRYSSLQLQVSDPDLAAMKMSGVFNVGDTSAFVEAVLAYLPATADYSNPNFIRLRLK